MKQYHEQVMIEHNGRTLVLPFLNQLMTELSAEAYYKLEQEIQHAIIHCMAIHNIHPHPPTQDYLPQDK